MEKITHSPGCQKALQEAPGAVILENPRPNYGQISVEWQGRSTYNVNTCVQFMNQTIPADPLMTVENVARYLTLNLEAIRSMARRVMDMLNENKQAADV